MYTTSSSTNILVLLHKTFLIIYDNIFGSTYKNKFILDGKDLWYLPLSSSNNSYITSQFLPCSNQSLSIIKKQATTDVCHPLRYFIMSVPSLCTKMRRVWASKDGDASGFSLIKTSPKAKISSLLNSPSFSDSSASSTVLIAVRFFIIAPVVEKKNNTWDASRDFIIWLVYLPTIRNINTNNNTMDNQSYHSVKVKTINFQ